MRLNFSQSFLRSDNFWLQNSAILRNAARIGFVPSTYEKQAVQRCEKMRNSLGLNYKSAANVQIEAGKRLKIRKPACRDQDVG
jgi:hypothetical protein